MSQGARALPAGLGVLLALELVALVYFTKYTADEGLYTLYPSMVLEGQVPYRDFFYHRLPLLPYLFVPALAFPFSMLLSVRILCAICAWGAWWLSALTAEAWTGSAGVRSGVLVLALFSLYGNSYLVTAQSYGPFALFLVYAIWLISTGNSTRRSVRFVGAGVAIGVAMGLRFGPDALLVTFPAAFAVAWYRREEWRDWGALAIGFAMVLVGLVALGAGWDARAFFWGVFVWPVKHISYLAEHGMMVEDGVIGFLRAKGSFVKETVEQFLPLVAVAVTGLAVRWRRGAFRAVVRPGVCTGAEQLAWILVLVQCAFFAAAPLGGALQLTFVLPLATACAVALPREAWGRLSRSMVVAMLVLGVAAGSVGDVPLSCSWRRPDVVVLAAIADQVRTEVAPDEYVFTFDPVVAANAGRFVNPGLEFEVFGILPQWSDERVSRFHLLNWPLLQQALGASRTGAVVTGGRRLADDFGAGQVLRPYREELLGTIARDWRLVYRLDVPACVGVGPVSIYRRAARIEEEPSVEQRSPDAPPRLGAGTRPS